MKVKTSDLIGPALDWAVTKCEVPARGVHQDYLLPNNFKPNHEAYDFCYSTDWAQGGPIIEREKIDVAYYEQAYWGATIFLDLALSKFLTRFGPTPLIAAMRCYVASKFGDTVEIPEELLK